MSHAPAFFECVGSMGAMMRAHDWSHSQPGVPQTLAEPAPHERQPDAGLGVPDVCRLRPNLAFLYNDAYAEILGDKHPAALGRGFQEIWSAIWPDIAPLIDRSLSGEATWSENMPLAVPK